MNRYVDIAWFGQVHRMRRTDPIYKPALLLVVLDLIDEELASKDFVPLDLALKRFDALLVRARLVESRGRDRGHMPAYHLSSSSSTEEPFWDLLQGGAPIGVQNEPSSNRGLEARADGLRLKEALAAELALPDGTALARAAIYDLLERDSRTDCRALLAYHDQDLPFVEQAVEDLARREAGPFVLDDPNATKVRAFQERYRRDRSLRRVVLPAYAHACALCSTRIKWNDQVEVEVAHIKPRFLKGVDDPRNTLALCHTHHWAFDLGLWSALDDLRVLVKAPSDPRGDDLAALQGFEGKRLRVPDRASAAPHADALRWHREHPFARAA